jgi:hypothetical protein
MANTPSTFERKWPTVILTPISVANHVVTVSSTAGLHTKQIVTLSKTGQQSQDFEIKRVLSDTQIQVGSADSGMLSFMNPVQFNGGMLTMSEQERNKFDSNIVLRAVYEEEPAVALRNLLVGRYGNPIDTSIDTQGNNRLQVDADKLPDSDDIIIDRDADDKPLRYHFMLANVEQYYVDIIYNNNGSAVEYKTTVLV